MLELSTIEARTSATLPFHAVADHAMAFEQLLACDGSGWRILLGAWSSGRRRPRKSQEDDQHRYRSA